jgi:hypothetical protein
VNSLVQHMVLAVMQASVKGLAAAWVPWSGMKESPVVCWIAE